MGVLTLPRGGRSLKYDDPSLQVRVLVVDDHEPFRRFVSSTLENQPNGQTSPASRIIFLSQESSVDIVQEAFNAGAWGYVVKTQAARELLIAVETVLQGKRFVSSGLEGHGVANTA